MTIRKTSPFKYSNDNKRYHTFNYYLKSTYGSKVFKVPIDAGFTCPNRDGTVAIGGCSFCSARGSGDNIYDGQLEEQIADSFEIMRNKWPDGLAMAYFQAYTNTHDSLENLKKLYSPFFEDDRFEAISIATRADALDDEKIRYFKEMALKKDLWIEIGLQTIHQDSIHRINRAHDTAIVTEMVKKLKESNIKVCLHIINGLPYETPQMMLETARHVSQLDVDGLKIHMFHVIENTLEAHRFETKPYPLLSMDEYIDVTINQLEILPPTTIIQRLSGDGVARDLVAPLWTLKKSDLLNGIDKELKRRNTYQGIDYEKHE